VIPHPWGINNGMAQLGALGLQKGQLLKLLPMLDISCHVKQATGIRLGQLSGLVLLRKLALKEGDLSNKAFCILASKG
jgi:hypothetical protein